MCLLENKDSIKEAICTYNKIFKNKDPFDDCFRDEIDSKILLFPTDGYILRRRQFESLIKTMNILGEKDMYISQTEWMIFENAEHYLTNVNVSYMDYKKMPIFLENAIYSKEGKWGIIISHEDHALLGGSKEFINNYLYFYGNLENDIKKFSEYWRECKQNYPNIDDKWVNKILNISTYL